MTPDHFRKQAEALYNLAKAAKRADERLALALQAMEFEARAVDAERGKKIPQYMRDASAYRDRHNA